MSTANHGSSLRLLMVATMLAATVYGCVRGQPSYGVKPGDVDFPRENPRPTHEFQLEAVLPPTLPVRFKLVYSASLHTDTKPGEVPPCHYVTDTGQVLPFSVLVPLQLKFENDDPELGEYYGGMVAVDRYLPGRCRWELTGGMYSLDGDPKRDMPLFQYDNSVAYARDDPKTHDCMRVPSSYRSRRPDLGLAPIVCATGLAAAQRANDFDAANLIEDIAEVGNMDPYVSFFFWDRDNPLPRGVVNVTLRSSPPPPSILLP
jgi:hypothetical protein